MFLTVAKPGGEAVGQGALGGSSVESGQVDDGETCLSESLSEWSRCWAPLTMAAVLVVKDRSSAK